MRFLVLVLEVWETVLAPAPVTSSSLESLSPSHSFPISNFFFMWVWFGFLSLMIKKILTHPVRHYYLHFFKMRKPKLREVKWFTQGYPNCVAGPGFQFWSVSLESPCSFYPKRLPWRLPVEQALFTGWRVGISVLHIFFVASNTVELWKCLFFWQEPFGGDP